VLVPFLSKNLRQDLANIYAYCRWADDLADESETPEEALQRLGIFETLLNRLFKGKKVKHPVFWALGETVERHELEKKPFLDLISAFKQDQVKSRYETFEDLIDYCSRSADPVGRLVLGCFDALDEENIYYSDLTCSGLQLTNFWADVGIDLDKERIYIPAEDMRRFGITEEDLLEREMNPELRDLLAFEVERSRDWLLCGRKLLNRLGFFASFSVDIFNSGGLGMLKKLKENEYEVFACRCKLSKTDKYRILFSAMGRLVGRQLGLQ